MMMCNMQIAEDFIAILIILRCVEFSQQITTEKELNDIFCDLPPLGMSKVRLKRYFNWQHPTNKDSLEQHEHIPPELPWVRLFYHKACYKYIYYFICYYITFNF